MKDLRAARVVIVDDLPDEGDGFRLALARDGVPALVFSRLEDLPSRPFAGVRLAALDADFTGIFGTTSDNDAITDPTAAILARLLAPGNGPYHALIWTSHPELAASLESRLAAHGRPPAACTTLAKEEVFSEGQWDVETILRRIEESRSDQPGLRFLSEWEGAVFDAGVATVDQLLHGETDTEVLGALTYTERRQAPAGQKLRAIAESLSRLHADALDRRADQYSAEIVDQLLGGDIPKPDEEQKAQLHARLLLGPAHAGASPGSIYRLDDIAGRLRKPKWFPGIAHIEQDFGGDADLIKGREATPVAVEVTPLCDEHRESRIARFLVGVGVPIAQLSKGELRDLRRLRSPALRNFGPIAIPDLGSVDIVWCSRLIFSSPVDQVSSLMPLGRLRSDVLVDLQSWNAAQASRPGFLSIST